MHLDVQTWALGLFDWGFVDDQAECVDEKSFGFRVPGFGFGLERRSKVVGSVFFLDELERIATGRLRITRLKIEKLED